MVLIKLSTTHFLYKHLHVTQSLASVLSVFTCAWDFRSIKLQAVSLSLVEVA